MAAREEWGEVLRARWDTATGLYTRYEEDGTLAESRPLTDEEVASLTPAPNPRAQRIADIRARLAAAPLLFDERDEIMAELLDLVEGGT